MVWSVFVFLINTFILILKYYDINDNIILPVKSIANVQNSCVPPII